MFALFFILTESNKACKGCLLTYFAIKNSKQVIDESEIRNICSLFEPSVVSICNRTVYRYIKLESRGELETYTVYDFCYRIHLCDFVSDRPPKNFLLRILFYIVQIIVGYVRLFVRWCLSMYLKLGGNGGVFGDL